MPIPDYQALMLPVLKVAKDGKDHLLSDFRAQVAIQLETLLMDDELSERLPSGSEGVFSNRIAWAVQHLKWAGALKSVKRAVYQITDRGSSLLKENPTGISVKVLRQYPEFIEAVQRGSPSTPKALSVEVGDSLAVVPEPTSTPEESLEANFVVLRESLANDLLEAIKNGTPAAFEQIVVDLLVAMGYGGSVEDAGRVVGKSGDGGIDGIIKQDKLGLDVIYVQAKRWGNVVGSPEIMKFSGSLTKKHASRGVFITTSTFTKDALEFVEEMPQKLVLIDGKQLAALMIEHDVGVSATRSYTLKRLDQDYFENL